MALVLEQGRKKKFHARGKNFLFAAEQLCQLSCFNWRKDHQNHHTHRAASHPFMPFHCTPLVEIDDNQYMDPIVSHVTHPV